MTKPQPASSPASGSGAERITDTLKRIGLPLASGSPDGPLILLVDDEEPVLMLGEIILQERGYRVIPASRPTLALQAFIELHDEIDLVLVDFKMPEMTGGQLFEEMRKIDPSIPTMLISGFADRDDVDRMIASGLNGYLQKPFSSISLIRGVEDLLAG